MSSELSPPNAEPVDVSIPIAALVPSRGARSRSSTKAAATVRRRKEERRSDQLREIGLQIADGTLVVRHMTVAQHEEASEAGRQASERMEARVKLNRAHYNRDGAGW
jgi:hypothetical protein